MMKDESVNFLTLKTICTINHIQSNLHLKVLRIRMEKVLSQKFYHLIFCRPDFKFFFF